MIWVDLIAILVLVVYAIDGFRRGFLEILLELISFIIAVFLAFKLSLPIGIAISKIISMPLTMRQPVGFLVVWLLCQLIFSIGIRYIYRLVPNRTRKSMANKLAGIAASAAKGLVLIAIVFLLITVMPISSGIKSSVNNSWIGSRVVKASAGLDLVAQRLFGKLANDTLTFLTLPPPFRESVKRR